MNNNPSHKLSRQQSQSSIFDCFFCPGREEDFDYESRKEIIFTEANPPKLAANFIKPQILPIQKSSASVTRYSLKKKSQIFIFSDLNQFVPPSPPPKLPLQNESFFLPSEIKESSLRTTNESNLRFTFNSSAPRIKFIYEHSDLPQKSMIKQSLVCIDSTPEFQYGLKTSYIDKISTSSSFAFNHLEHPFGPPSPVPSSTSPLNKIFRNTHKEILVSTQFFKKSSNSFENPQMQSKKLKRAPSVNQPFKGKIKVRQAESIRQPQEELNMESIVISGSEMFGHLALLPIRQNQFQAIGFKE